MTFLSRRRVLSLTAATAAPLSLTRAVPPQARPRAFDPGWSGDWPPPLREAVLRAMPAAVEYARAAAKWPYGAVLVDAETGAVVAGASNTGESGDPTAHAETNLVREAVGGGFELSEHVVVTSAEPCPMCAGVLVWGGVRGVAYGTSIAKLVGWGVPQIDVPMDEIFRRARGLSRPALARDVRADLTDPLYRGSGG
ncbi:nucleoside deaminase [Streptomyces sp. NPDC001678]|uniref:nucleoside deaminase n=1 Tax=Streptomyces sp. NPDC001678 TaxID=3364599 RepID=UPI0036C7BD5A